VWSKDRSILLPQICTRCIIILAVLLGIVLPWLCISGFFNGRALISPENIFWLLPIYYAFCLPAIYALYTLDRMLLSVKNGNVFTANNVSCLRTISWCCFVASAILLAASLVSIVFFALAILAAFFGVILRAVKNLFAAAVFLQAENDLTI
jgi:hypothetical protein